MRFPSTFSACVFVCVQIFAPSNGIVSYPASISPYIIIVFELDLKNFNDKIVDDNFCYFILFSF